MKSDHLRPGATLEKLSAYEPIAYDDSKIRFITERCRGKRVLDLGCVMHDADSRYSRYWLHRAIAEVAEEAIGLDLYEEGVAALREAGYNAVVGDAEKLTYDSEFDVVVAGDLIEHLANLGGFLEGAMRALRPGGMLLVQTPNPWYWKYVVKAVIHEEVPNNEEHTCWFDPRTFRQLIARYGLTLGAVEYQSRYRRDRMMPLPRGLKHTSWAAEVVRAG